MIPSGLRQKRGRPASTLASFLTRRKTEGAPTAEAGMSKTKTRVVALRRRGETVLQDCDVYIVRACDRGGWALPQSKWHNPFTIKSCGSAEKAIEKYKTFLLKNAALMADVGSLRGKVLGCWCKKPQTPHAACHGDILAKLADEALMPETQPCETVQSVPENAKEVQTERPIGPARGGRKVIFSTQTT